MKQTVYVDVLFCVNLFVNYFLLLFTVRMVQKPVKKRRVFGGALLGALYSLFIFFPHMSILSSAFAKLIFSFSILMAVFGVVSARMFFKAMACFYSANFAFAGVMLALWLAFSPPGMVVNNGVVYFNISPVILIAGSVLTYLILLLIGKFTRRYAPAQARYCVTIEANGESVKLDALMDTGNSLTDLMSEKPVLLAECEAVQKLIPQNLRAVFQSPAGKASQELMQSDALKALHFRMIPFDSVGGEGLLPAFRTDRIVIQGGKTEVCAEGIYVAVSSRPFAGGEYDVLLNPQLLSVSPSLK